VLNEAPHHADIWKSGGKGPRILKLGIRWRLDVSSMPQVPYKYLKKSACVSGIS
jgi:hypothetical protein